MEVLRTAILDMLRRRKGGSFSTAAVVQQMFPEDWQQFVGDVNRVAMELYHEGLIKITDDGTGDYNSLKISQRNKL